MTAKKKATTRAAGRKKPAKKTARRLRPLTAWQKFERMVAMIEQTFAPHARVKSPDHVADVVTGELRQVDATIRTKVGSAETLVVIECRKRKHAQDVMWIEQLITKRQQIGAQPTLRGQGLKTWARW